MDHTTERQTIIQEALTWQGTPFANRARVKGVGTDCAGFLAGVAENARVTGKVNITPYSWQHMLHSNEEIFIQFLDNLAREIPESDVQPADIVLYKCGKTYSHAAIIIEWPERIIHAVRDGRAGVVQSHGTREAWVQGKPRKFYTFF